MFIPKTEKSPNIPAWDSGCIQRRACQHSFPVIPKPVSEGSNCGLENYYAAGQLPLIE